MDTILDILDKIAIVGFAVVFLIVFRFIIRFTTVGLKDNELKRTIHGLIISTFLTSLAIGLNVGILSSISKEPIYAQVITASLITLTCAVGSPIFFIAFFLIYLQFDINRAMKIAEARRDKLSAAQYEELLRQLNDFFVEIKNIMVKLFYGRGGIGE